MDRCSIGRGSSEGLRNEVHSDHLHAALCHPHACGARAATYLERLRCRSDVVSGCGEQPSSFRMAAQEAYQLRCRTVRVPRRETGSVEARPLGHTLRRCSLLLHLYENGMFHFMKRFLVCVKFENLETRSKNLKRRRNGDRHLRIFIGRAEQRERNLILTWE